MLFCPGDDDDKLTKLVGRGVTTVALDLEDAVHPSRRGEARRLVARHLPRLRRTMAVYVRVDAGRSAELALDVAVAAEGGARGIILPKVESGDTVVEVLSMLDAHGHPPLTLVLMVETARGLLDLGEILEAAPERVETLMFGSVDYSEDIGLAVGADERELDLPRSLIVAHARAAGLAAPLDGPHLDLTAVDFTESCERSRDRGFAGRVCLTPTQASVADRVYGTSSANELAWARETVDAFVQAQQRGRAVARVRGAFVDPPVYRRALDILSRAGLHHSEENHHV